MEEILSSSDAPLGLMGAIATNQFVQRIKKKLRYEPTYQLRPRTLPNMSRIYQLIRRTTDARLSTYVYDPNTAHTLSRTIAAEVKKCVKDQEDVREGRYRVVTMATIGEKAGQGVQIASHYICSTPMDSHVSYTLESISYFCIITVYVIYKE
ncbi:dynein light chain Tctex-type protein 2B-like [Watersipora subatra]|uniref:dynein light chain Tctex-type protein 2B-like n=1 Tax=Watersipora subatra TaxID=2589382 RepID=UPI00355B7EFC